MKSSYQNSRVAAEPVQFSLREHQPDVLRLFEDILGNGTDLRVSVTGSSMLPFLKAGEVLTIRQVPGHSLQRGDLILFRDSSDLPVLHRILKIKKNPDGMLCFFTKGDALTTYDEEVRETSVVGKVREIIRAGTSGTVSSINMDSVFRKITNYLTAVMGCYATRGRYS